MTLDLKLQLLMENIQKIRLANLKLIRDMAEYGYRDINGKKKKYTDIMFAEYLGISQPLYSMLSNRKDTNFTEKTARKIESNIELPPNWLDVDHESDNYEEVFIHGSLIKSLMFEFKTFLETENINFDNNSAELETVVEKAILKTSKFQKISFSDFISLYFDKDSS